MNKLIIAVIIGILGIFGVKSTLAAPTNISARVEDPKSPINANNFLLGFVALDRLNREMTVQCFVNASATPFQTINLAPGGSSGNCEVASGVIPASGTYQFRITASAGTDSVTTSDVSVKVTVGGPGTPTNYKKTKVSNCQNNISVTTADDGGKTVRVEMYRSIQRTFTADDSTKVASIDAGSSQPVSYTDTEPVCAESYYYAVRAFDALGNGSGTVADERVVVQITGGGTTTITNAVAAPGAIPAAGGGAVAGTETGGATGGEVAGEQTPLAENAAPGAEEQGQVLGEEQNKAEEPQNFFQRNKILFAIGTLVILGIIYYYYAATKKRKPEFPEPPKTPTGQVPPKV